MKILNDYCFNCNTDRVVAKIDSADSYGSICLCQNCMEYALIKLYKHKRTEDEKEDGVKKGEWIKND